MGREGNRVQWTPTSISAFSGKTGFTYPLVCYPLPSSLEKCKKQKLENTLCFLYAFNQFAKTHECG